MTPRLIVVNDYAELSQLGAERVAALIAARPAAALVLATGDTPMGLYGEPSRDEGRRG